MFFYLVEESAAVKESYLETISLFLSHQPIDNYLMKIEAKSKAGQKSVGTAGSAIAKSLKSTFYLAFLEIMLSEDKGKSVILKHIQRLFEFVEEMGIEKQYIRTLIDLYLLPNAVNMKSIDFETFEGSVITLETLIRLNKAYIAPATITLISKVLIDNFNFILKHLDTLPSAESYIGLLLGVFTVVFPKNTPLFLCFKDFLLSSFESILPNPALNERKNQILEFLIELVSQIQASIAAQKCTGLKTYELYNRLYDAKQPVLRCTRPRSNSLDKNAQTARGQVSTTVQQLQASRQLFSVILDSFVKGEARSDHIENSLIALVEKLGPAEFLISLANYSKSFDGRVLSRVLEQINDSLTKEKNQLSFIEIVLTNPSLSSDHKSAFFARLFASLDMRSLATDKICALSRILFSIRYDLRAIDAETISTIYNISLKALKSEKRKVVSNGIRMLGLLLNNLPEDSLFDLLEDSAGFGLKQTGLEYIVEQFRYYLRHEFAKYAWNVTFCLAQVFLRFDVFGPTLKPAQKLRAGKQSLVKRAKAMLPLIVENFIESTNVKLKLHSLSIICSAGVLRELTQEECLDTIKFVVELNSGSWSQKASPEYSDIKFLNQLKSNSIDLSIDFIKLFDELDYGSDHFIPVMTLFDQIIGRMRDELLAHGVDLERVDEDTGKLIQNPVLTFPAQASVMRIFDCFTIMKRKLQKYDDLCLSLFRFEKMNKIVDFQLKDGTVTLENVFVETRVTNEA